jgi:glucan phosphorylase
MRNDAYIDPLEGRADGELPEPERQKDCINMSCHEDKHMTDTVAAFAASIRQHVRYSLGKKWQKLSDRDLFMAIALTLRDWMVDRMLATEERYQKAQAKRLYYLSMEYLIGR